MSDVVVMALTAEGINPSGGMGFCWSIKELNGSLGQQRRHSPGIKSPVLPSWQGRVRRGAYEKSAPTCDRNREDGSVLSLVPRLLSRA